MRRIKIVGNKKAQEIFGMSFSMIFSIILIVFFIVVAFIAIRYFLNYQKCTEVGLFFRDFEDEAKKAFNSDSASYYFNSTLPSGVEYFCIINTSANSFNANSAEKAIYDYILKKETINFKSNVYIYSPKKEYCVKWKEIANIDISYKNPICIKNIGGKVSVKIERNFDSPFVKITAA